MMYYGWVEDARGVVWHARMRRAPTIRKARVGVLVDGRWVPYDAQITRVTPEMTFRGRVNEVIESYDKWNERRSDDG